jgi:hypothetical protein
MRRPAFIEGLNSLAKGAALSLSKCFILSVNRGGVVLMAKKGSFTLFLFTGFDWMLQREHFFVERSGTNGCGII